MKTLDWSVETLGLDYNSTGLSIHLHQINQSSERRHNSLIVGIILVHVDTVRYIFKVQRIDLELKSDMKSKLFYYPI